MKVFVVLDLNSEYHGYDLFKGVYKSIADVINEYVEKYQQCYNYTKEQVLGRVSWLNKLTGENYRASKAYGGWDLYIETPTHGHSRGCFGFDAKKSTQEFMEYLYGICTAICYCRNNK